MTYSLYDIQETQTWGERRDGYVILTKMVRWRVPRFTTIPSPGPRLGPPAPPADSVLMGDTIRTKLIKDPLPPLPKNPDLIMVDYGDEWTEWYPVETRIEEVPGG